MIVLTTLGVDDYFERPAMQILATAPKLLGPFVKDRDGKRTDV